MTTNKLRKQEVYKGHIFTVFREEIRLPSGKTTERSVVRHPGAAIIVPQDTNGELLMVRQYRYALDRQLLEFPAGTLEPGEAPLACAKREIQEEVGHQAAEWLELGPVHPAPGFCDEVQHCFLARGLSPSTAPLDEDEILSVERHSPEVLERLIVRGEVTDAKTLAVFALLKARGLISAR